MKLKELWDRIKKYFSFRWFKHNNIPQVNLDEDILESEYGKLNDTQNPVNYF